MVGVIPEYQPVLQDSRTISHGIFQAEWWRGSALLFWSLWLQLLHLPSSPLSGTWTPPSHEHCSQFCLWPSHPWLFSLCLSNRFNSAPPYISSLIICVRKLSAHSRNLLNSWCPPALPFQQLSRWLYISLRCISYFKWLQCFKTVLKKFLSF